jgi:protein-tyrosine-phosphatase
MRILVICTGNTCRSPLAEGLMKKMAREEGILDLDVTSAGTSAVAGLPATQNAVTAAREKGLDISSHRSRLLTPRLVVDADIVLGMEHGHVEFAERLGGKGKTFLITRYPHGEGDEIRDPIGRPLPDYRATLDRLDKEVRRIVALIMEGEGRSSHRDERT